MIDPRFITTALDLEGYRITRHCGVVRGIVVRSRSAIGNFAAGIQTFFGGNISVYTELCEQARQEAFDLMRQHGYEAGGNAIIGMRYDANDVAAGVTEVLAYGTSVVVELRSKPPEAPEQPAGNEPEPAA
ncbi:MAG: YbjQ family protein [Planctomycetes bacterium]|nr:YbjQ family protein [Planctomycetota bacterium]